MNALISLTVIYLGCSALGIVLWLMYRIPIRVALSGSSYGDTRSFYLRISWGILGGGVYGSPDGMSMRGECGGVSLVCQQIDDITTFHVPQSDDTREWSISGIREMIPLMKAGIRFLPYLVHHISCDSCQADLTVGLGDPAYTGMVYGYYHAFRSLVTSDRCSLDIRPDFSRINLEGTIEGSILITTPFDLLVRGVRVFLPDIITLWRGNYE